MTVAIVDLLCTFGVLTSHRTLVLMATTFAVTVIVATVSCRRVTEATDAKKTLHVHTVRTLAEVDVRRLGLELKNVELQKKLTILAEKVSQPVEISTLPAFGIVTSEAQSNKTLALV